MKEVLKPRGRPLPPLVLSPSEQEALQRRVARPKTAQALVLRARIMLACAQVGLVGQHMVPANHNVGPSHDTFNPTQAPPILADWNLLTQRSRNRSSFPIGDRRTVDIERAVTSNHPSSLHAQASVSRPPALGHVPTFFEVGS